MSEKIYTNPSLTMAAANRKPGDKLDVGQIPPSKYPEPGWERAKRGEPSAPPTK